MNVVVVFSIGLLVSVGLVVGVIAPRPIIRPTNNTAIIIMRAFLDMNYYLSGFDI